MMNTSTSPLRVITLKDGLMVKEVPEVNACQGCMFIADCEECDGMAYDELGGCSIRHTIYQPADPEPTNPEPVGYLWRHASTGRTRLVEPDCVITHRPGWSPVGPQFLGQPETVKPEPLTDEHVRRDAERYRFIRDADRSDCITRALSLYAMESLDEYVDAAMEDEKRAHGIGEQAGQEGGEA